MQLNKDSRNVAVPASTYGENGMIENVPKKLTNGVIASENEVIRFRPRKKSTMLDQTFYTMFCLLQALLFILIYVLDAKTMLFG